MSHNSLTSIAEKSRRTLSSCTGGPGRVPARPRFFPNVDHQRLSRQIRHAVRSAIDSPVSTASSRRNRCPNSGDAKTDAQSVPQNAIALR